MDSEWLTLLGVVLGSGLTLLATVWQAQRSERVEKSRQAFEATNRARESLRKERLALHTAFTEILDAAVGVTEPGKSKQSGGRLLVTRPEWFDGQEVPAQNREVLTTFLSLMNVVSHMRLICSAEVVAAAEEVAAEMREASVMPTPADYYRTVVRARDQYVAAASLELGARF